MPPSAEPKPRQPPGAKPHGGITAYQLPLTANLINQTRETSSEASALSYTNLQMKSPDGSGCLIVLQNGFIIFDVSSADAQHVTDLLISIAEPISRPMFIQEYQLTVFSLFAAMSVGISSERIVSLLQQYAKNVLDASLIRTIEALGCAFGRVKLVLRNSKYYIESHSKADIDSLMRFPIIAASRVESTLEVRYLEMSDAQLAESAALHAEESQRDVELSLHTQLDAVLPQYLKVSYVRSAANEPFARAADAQLAPDAAKSKKLKVYCFQVQEKALSAIKEAALHELGKPLLTEYDALNDTTNPTLHIELRQTTKLRYYQKRALSRIFHNGRARSGIVVLPCGAGKTLLGIAACALIKKSTIILTSNSVSVEQWRVSLLQFSTVDPAQIVVLTSDAKGRLPDGPCIVCTTYTMISFSGQRSELAEEATNQIRARDWGLLIFDEVQFAPAPAFRRVTEQCRSHCKVGLTATLVREDNLIDDLHWMVGPKLDEANWQELQKNGFLARAKCSEVWCPMTLEFYRAFNQFSRKSGVTTAGHKKRVSTVLRKLWTCNPNKLRVCEYLIQFHEARGDKVIVFSDYLMALKVMAVSLKRPFISGDVPTAERVFILNKFKTDPSEKTIFLSKVGDNAIDIPCANVVIQISFNYASRRQETQRLGRILRPKPGLQQHSQYNAFFYSLASQDTPEIIYADKRQQYLIDQGYAYQIISLNKLPLEKASLVFSDPEKQKELLHSILVSADSDDGSDVEVSTTCATESVL